MDVVFPQDNTIDLTIITKHAEELMKRMTEHHEKLMRVTMDWVDIKKRVPPNDCSVLLAVYDARPGVEMFFLAMGYRMNNMWYYGHDGSEIGGKGSRVTHWMQLPDKPNKKEFLESGRY